MGQHVIYHVQLRVQEHVILHAHFHVRQHAQTTVKDVEEPVVELAILHARAPVKKLVQEVQKEKVLSILEVPIRTQVRLVPILEEYGKQLPPLNYIFRGCGRNDLKGE